MKAISILTDDARDVAAGRQTLHAKCWSTDYRGPVLLCGARPHTDRHPADAICVVELVDCRRIRPGDGSDAGRSEESMGSYTYVWQWANPRPVASVRVQAEWGVFSVEDALIVYADGKAPPAPHKGKLTPPVITLNQPQRTGLVDVDQAKPAKATPAADAGQSLLFG